MLKAIKDCTRIISDNITAVVRFPFPKKQYISAANARIRMTVCAQIMFPIGDQITNIDKR